MYENGKNNAKNTATKRSLHIVRGATIATLLYNVFPLVNLRKGGFHKSGGSTENGNHPHPKHGARASQANDRRNTYDVSGTYARGGRDHQSAERRYFATLDGLLENHAKRFTEQANLGSLEVDGKKDTRSQ